MAGADRFRNPDENLPADFAVRRAVCYERLGLPTEARTFTDALRAEMARRAVATRSWDAAQPGCPPRPASAASDCGPARANLSLSRRGWLALKVELGRCWPMTGLLDVLKEADSCASASPTPLPTAATREAIDRDEVRRRLLLCLYGLGTNAGLKRLAVGRHGFSYKELLHTRRHYIDADALARRDPARGQRDACRAPSSDLARGHDRLRLGQQAFRRLRPEPDDRVARPLRLARGHDLLARRARLGVHPLAAATLLVAPGPTHEIRRVNLGDLKG